MILCYLKKLFQLIQPVIVCDILLLFRTLHLVGRIKRDQVHFHGIFQSFVDVCVFVNHRVGRNGFHLMQIEALNMLGLNTFDSEAGISEVRHDLSLYHLRIR